MFTTGKILSKEQMEELQKNPFFDKYAEKIAQLQKWVERTSKFNSLHCHKQFTFVFIRKNPEEFLARIEAKTATDQGAKPKDFSLPGQAKQKLEASALGIGQEPKQKSLESVVKLELLADKSAKEIEEIWCKHFSSKVSS